MAERLDSEPTDYEEHVRVNEHGDFRRQERYVRNVGAERHQALYQVSQFIWLLTIILEGLLGLRFVLKLIAANPGAPFANFIYSITELFLLPFQGLTVTPSAAGMVLEFPTLIAMLVYLLLAWVVVRLIWVVFDRPTARSVSTYERD